MFIPRTLSAHRDPLPRGTVARAATIIGILTVALGAVLSFTLVPREVDLRAGEVSQQTIQAPRTITFLSDSETEAAQAEAADAVQPVYVEIAPRVDIRDQQLRALDRRVSRVSRVLAEGVAEGSAAEQIAVELQVILPELAPSVVSLIPTLEATEWDAVVAASRTVLEDTLVDDVPEDRISDIQDAVRNRITGELSEPDRTLAGELAVLFLVPNMAVSEEETAAARDAARQQVEPVQVTVLQGESIIREGERISRLEVETLEELGLTQPQLEVRTLLGNVLLAAVISVLLIAFLVRFRPEIWHRGRSMTLFALALVVSAAAIKLVGGTSVWSFVVPTAAAVMLIGILLESATAAALAAALAVITGVVNGESLELAALTLAGGIVSIVALSRAERLNAFVRVGVVLALTNTAVVVAFSLMGQRDVTGVAQLVLAVVGNAALSTVLAVGSFAVLGNLFGISTIFQLLELANPSSPLLRRLLLETPGTYHHSVMVGNLGERAAETIGADPLLVRVAAYYHDIGKMKNPLAFIENQAGSRNVHDELPAQVSARIITSHIRDGIDLGYQYGLPVQIIGFIPQHHGTSVMSYFYGKAVREAARDEAAGRPIPEESGYRYPGPRPQNREAAILMLADGVEASVRSLDDKDEESIRAMVARIVEARVEDGQLDDSDLTLRDIRDIKEAFVQQLLGMYHSRIKYPENVVPIERREREAG